MYKTTFEKEFYDWLHKNEIIYTKELLFLMNALYGEYLLDKKAKK
jgi:hypothetical protein